MRSPVAQASRSVFGRNRSQRSRSADDRFPTCTARPSTQTWRGAKGRFDSFAKPSVNGRYVRIPAEDMARRIAEFLAVKCLQGLRLGPSRSDLPLRQVALVLPATLSDRNVSKHMIGPWTIGAQLSTSHSSPAALDEHGMVHCVRRVLEVLDLDLLTIDMQRNLALRTGRRRVIRVVFRLRNPRGPECTPKTETWVGCKASPTDLPEDFRFGGFRRLMALQQ
jgi:hypothetical protein